MATLPKKPPAPPMKSKAKDPAQRVGKLKKVPPTGMNFATKGKPVSIPNPSTVDKYVSFPNPSKYVPSYAKGGVVKKETAKKKRG